MDPACKTNYKKKLTSIDIRECVCVCKKARQINHSLWRKRRNEKEQNLEWLASWWHEWDETKHARESQDFTSLKRPNAVIMQTGKLHSLNAKLLARATHKSAPTFPKEHLLVRLSRLDKQMCTWQKLVQFETRIDHWRYMTEQMRIHTETKSYWKLKTKIGVIGSKLKDKFVVCHHRTSVRNFGWQTNVWSITITKLLANICWANRTIKRILFESPLTLNSNNAGVVNLASS